MEQHGELLNYIYQNAEMGVDTIKQLLTIVEDEDFIQQLQVQFNEYKDISCKAKDILDAKAEKSVDIGTFAKIRTYMMINFQTMTDNSPSHIAEMLIIGSNMGIIQSIRKLKDYPDACAECTELMGKLQKTEQNNIEQLKKYL